MPPEQVAAWWAAMEIIAEMIATHPPTPEGASPQIAPQGRRDDLGGMMKGDPAKEGGAGSKCPGKDGALQQVGEAQAMESASGSE